jgi:hypothetical protein
MVISAFRASLVRLWNHRERAWCRRRQSSQAFVAGRSRDGAGIGEQVLDLRDGERDHAGVGGRRLVRADRFRCLGIGSVAQQGSGDGADGQGGHDQDEMPGDGCVQPDLGLVQSEAVLAELEIFFSQPLLIPVKKKSSLAFRVHPGRY